MYGGGEAFAVICTCVLRRPGPGWDLQVFSQLGLTMISKVADGQACDLTENLAEVTFLGILEVFHPNSFAWDLSLKFLPHSSSSQHHLGVQVVFRFAKFLISNLYDLCFPHLPVSCNDWITQSLLIYSKLEPQLSLKLLSPKPHLLVFLTSLSV